jgi:hypothetical protein
MNKDRDDRSFGTLFSELSDEIKHLVSEELVLLKNEMADKMMHAVKDVVFLAAGGMVLYTGFLGLIASLITGIGVGIALWLSALIVGLMLAVIGYMLIQKGLRDLKRQTFVPRGTIASIKAETRWIKEHL